MRVHYKGSSTFCCNSDAPCAEHAEKYPPAQSDAPSAEQKFSGSGAKAWWWENVKRTPFKMTPERIWRHMEAYAALRIARAEQDLRNEKEERKSFEQGWLIEKGKRETAEAKVAQLEKDVAALAQVVKDYERINATLHEEIVSQINQVGIAENQVAQLERERDKWQTLFYESEEYNCSCNIVDTSKPIGDPYNYVCDWHEQHPHITVARDEVITLSQRAETAESALSEARERAQKLEEIIQRVLDQLPQAIYGCRGCGGSGVTTGTEHHPDCEGGCRLCPIEVQVQCECEGKSVDVEGLLTELRALASGRVRCGG